MKLLLFLFTASIVCAADLESIRQTQAKLVKLRPNGDVPYPLPDPPPEFAELKHQIRDWAEEKIAKLRPDADLAGATSLIDGELSLAKLDHKEEHDLGDIGGITLEPAKGDASWLVVETYVWEANCTMSTSVYLYEWQRGGWTRRFALEERMEAVEHVEVGPPDAYQNRLVLVLGNSWGCASMWQQLYVRLFRVAATQQLLRGGEQTVYMGFEEESYHGKLETKGALIEYVSSGTDTELRRFILHFEIDGESVRRVEPVALTAQDFVDEWLNSQRDHAFWDFDFVQHCPGNADHWQIGVTKNDDDDDALYFMVEQSPNYRFRILDVSKERQEGCPGEDPPREIGPNFPTLFPAKKP